MAPPEATTSAQVKDSTAGQQQSGDGSSHAYQQTVQETYGPPQAVADKTVTAQRDTTTGGNVEALPPKPEHLADRGQFYISQMGDTNYGGSLFMCGSTSLYMACRDWHAKGSADVTGGQGFAKQPSENERVAVAKTTGVLAEGQFPGGPELMAQEAEKQGLKAKAYDSNTGANADQALSMNAMDAELAAGHSIILNGPNHFIYIAGKTANGQYIVGDPANPGVTTMNRQDIESRLVNAGRGFTAVWNPDMVAPRQFDDIPGGNAAPPVVDRGGPGSGGGNGSAFEGGGDRGSGGVPRTDEDFAPPPSDSPNYVGNKTNDEEEFYKKYPSFNKEFTDKLVNAVAGNEGNFSSVNWDDNGAGISVGLRQWNQKSGELPQFLEDLWKTNPDLFMKLYPELYKQLKEHGMDFNSIRDMTFFDGKNPTALGKEMAEAMKNPEMKQFQLDEARKWVVGAMQVGAQAGFKSEYGIACVADAINQAGPGKVQGALQDQQLQELVKGGKEEEAIQRMEQLLQRPGGDQRDKKIASAGMSSDAVVNFPPPLTVG